MKIARLNPALFVLALLAMPIQAQTAGQSLEALIGDFKRYSADFEQYTKDEQGRRAEETKGRFKVQRPDKFRWETALPFPQLIVSDGKYLWIYDEDLEQATRKPVDAQQTNAAALILNGDIAGLKRKFSIALMHDSQGEKLFELTPKGESNFEKIQLFFKAGKMKELLLVDILGKQTTLILSNAKQNPRFNNSIFKFKAPAGTDVIIEDAQG
ncbi:MAG: outer membrane lipoprotein chaperone LolA [Pseudomonadales bacterium]